MADRHTRAGETRRLLALFYGGTINSLIVKQGLLSSVPGRGSRNVSSVCLFPGAGANGFNRLGALSFNHLF